MRSYFRSISSFFWCDGISRTYYGGVVWIWWCQVSLVSVASVLKLVSWHLIISYACCPQYIWLEPVCPIIPVDSELLRVQLSLWFCDPVNLRFWVCQSSWESSFLWDPKILLWPSSWDHGILESQHPGHVTAPGNGTSSKVDRHQPEGTRAAGQAGLLSLLLLSQVPHNCFGTDVVFHSPVILRPWVC
jgi:hypothetical protein